MPESPPRRSALAASTAAHDLVQERTAPIIHRLYAPKGGFAEDIGISLPEQTNHAAESADLQVLWLAPGEWLIVGDIADYGAKIAAAGGTCTDLSHARLVFRLPSEAARRILAKGCPLDLRAESFPPGRCAQSVMANVSILVHHLHDGGHMDVYVARSYGRFMHDWLIDAASRD